MVKSGEARVAAEPRDGSASKLLFALSSSAVWSEATHKEEHLHVGRFVIR